MVHICSTIYRIFRRDIFLQKKRVQSSIPIIMHKKMCYFNVSFKTLSDRTLRFPTDLALKKWTLG